MAIPCTTHELRNELVEELNLYLVGESRAALDIPLTRDDRNKGMESEKSRRREKLRNSQEKGPRDPNRRSMPVRGEGTDVGNQERRSSRCQTDRGGKAFWDAEESDRHLP